MVADADRRPSGSASKEGFDGEDESPAWLGIGYITAEAGGLLILISIILTGLGVRRMRRADARASVLVRIGTVLVTIVLAAYVVAVWAMTAKPTMSAMAIAVLPKSRDPAGLTAWPSSPSGVIGLFAYAMLNAYVPTWSGLTESLPQRGNLPTDGE